MMRSMVQVEVLRAACCVAGADGDTSNAERELLKGLAMQTGVGRASLQAMVDRACEDSEFCNEQFRVLKAEPKEAMAILLDVAMSDGSISDSELQILSVLAKKLSVPDDIFVQLTAAAKAMAAERNSE